MEAIYSDYYPVFLYVDKYRFSRNWIYAPSTVPYALLRYIVSGSAVFTLGEEPYEVKAGDVFYIPQGSVLSCKAKEEIVFISIRFVGSIQFEGTDMLRNLWHIPIRYNFQKKPEMLNCFEHIFASALSTNTYKMLEIRGHLNLICAYLAQTSEENQDCDEDLVEDRKKMEAFFDVESIKRRAKKTAQNHNDPRITVILDYITTHPEQKANSRELAEMVGLSESTLRRLFKEKTGKTLYEFIKDTKMTNAARRLLISNEQIASIAYDLGYETPGYFGKRFKEVFGITPQEYRKISHEI